MSLMALKHLHLMLVILMGITFAARAGLVLAGSNKAQSLPLRVLPHLFATGVLLVGLGLTMNYGTVPGWVWLKLALLVGFLVVSGRSLKSPHRGTQVRGSLVALAFYLVAFSLGLQAGAMTST